MTMSTMRVCQLTTKPPDEHDDIVLKVDKLQTAMGNESVELAPLSLDKGM